MLGYDRERRLYLQNRSERRLRRSSYSSGVTRLLKLRKRRRRLSLQFARLWTKYSTKNLLQGHEICNRIVKKSSNTNYLLPRRPLFVSKNQTRKALSNAKSEVSFGGLRVHHKLCKKYFNPLKETGILRLRIQQQNDGHLRTTTENSELIETCPSIAKSPQEIMPMDSGITGENNFNDTSYWGSSTTHSLPTTGSGEIPPSITSELGNNLQLISYQPRRTSLMGNVLIHVDASDSGWGISSPLVTASGFWRPEEKLHSINVRELKTILFALQQHASKCENSTIKIYSDNRTALKYTTKSGGTTSVFLQELAVQIQELCNYHNIKVIYQHIPGVLNTQAGQTESSQTTILRISHSKTDVQHDPTAMGQTKDRCLCSEAQLSTTNLLDANLRPSSSSGCNETTLAQEGGQRLTRVVLVTPLWPSQFWFPMILNMKHLNPPIIWKMNKKWSLAAWLLSTTKGYKMV
ncbi:hypothetical protein G6F62_011422 [Rhizopus arrhizus]|nr:hypothetical protein G6F62_011422 [Rhizopus arrhizus]